MKNAGLIISRDPPCLFSFLTLQVLCSNPHRRLFVEPRCYFGRDTCIRLEVFLSLCVVGSDHISSILGVWSEAACHLHTMPACTCVGHVPIRTELVLMAGRPVMLPPPQPRGVPFSVMRDSVTYWCRFGRTIGDFPRSDSRKCRFDELCKGFWREIEISTRVFYRVSAL